MLKYIQRLSRAAAILSVLCSVGCVVEPPQPTPPPSKSPPPVVVTPPSHLPPVLLPPGPKVYSGSYAERLEAAARDTLAGVPVLVQRNANTVKLIIPTHAAFTANGVQLQPRITTVLDGVIRLCRDYSQSTISVKGFTDSTGSFEHNQHLSEQRAQNVGAYLGREIAVTRIRTAGYGPRYPMADNKTDTGRIQNRRIEIDMVTTP